MPLPKDAVLIQGSPMSPTPSSRNCATTTTLAGASILCLAMVLVACSDGEDGRIIDGRDRDAGTTPRDAGTDGGSAMADSGPPREVTLGGDRPARVLVPPGYDPEGVPRPLIILLHGYGANAAVQDIYWNFSRRASMDGFFLALPDGTFDAGGNRFWNATPACCDFGRTGTDDVAYLWNLVDEIKSEFAIDDSRLYFAGHSNGGFMAYRMACEHAEGIAAIFSLAGMTVADDSDCHATTPVSVLHAHGDADETVLYGGGDDLLGNGSGSPYPGAEETVRRWASRASCDLDSLSSSGQIDLDRGIDGAETEVRQYGSGCASGVDVTSWTIAGGGHIPAVDRDFAERVTAWLLLHRRP